MVSVGSRWSRLWWAASSAWKYSLATNSAVGAGFAGIFSGGDTLLNGDLGDKTLTELARRGGATPLAEWREFSEAFLSRVGVAEREGEPFVEAPLRGLRIGLRIELPGRVVLGDLETVGLKCPGASGLGERGFAGDGDEVEIESCLSDCARSLSPASRALLAGWAIWAELETLFGGEGDLEYGDAMAGQSGRR